MIPYGRHTLEEDDIRAVAESLRSDWITQGPRVEAFERALAERCGAKEAVVFANGSLALLAAYTAAGLGPGCRFVVTPLTFAATVSAGLWLGAKPIFSDVEAETGNLDLEAARRADSAEVRALVSVDYAGLPVDYRALRGLCRERGWVFISDACHSLGAECQGGRVGSLADMTVFSFHPVKSITTGEGGAVLTDDPAYAGSLRTFRHHGIEKTSDYYQVRSLGINARLTDFQCALGLSQLAKVDRFLEARRQQAARYSQALASVRGLRLPSEPQDRRSAWHLYVVGVPVDRWALVREMRSQGVGIQVHYEPVYKQPYFREPFAPCPRAEAFYEHCMSLPIYPGLKAEEQDRVVETLSEALQALA